MSALVIVCKSDSVELLSDAAYCEPTSGALGAIHSKLAPLPELNCVMAGRGSIPVMWITAYVAGLSCKTFDDVVANFEAIRADAAAYKSPDIPASDWDQSDVCLIGWSKSRNRPEGYMSRRKRLPEFGLTAGSLIPYDVGVFARRSVAVVNAFVESVRENPDAFDAESDGIAVMELLRRESFPLGEEREATVGHSVGGYVEHATVTCDGPTVCTIHKWSDEVGKLIVPSSLMVGA